MKGPLKTLIRTCWQHPWHTTLAMASSVLVTCALIVAPLLVGRAVDIATGQAPATGWWVTIADTLHTTSLTVVVAALVIVALARFGVQFVRRYFAGQMSLYAQHELRTQVLTTLQRTDGPTQDTVTTANIVSRTIFDLNAVQGLLAMTPLMWGSLVRVVLTFVVMLAISWQMSLATLVTVPILALIATASKKAIVATSWAGQHQSALVATHVEHTVAGVRVVKAFGGQLRESRRVDALTRALFGAKMRAARAEATYIPALSEVPNLAFIAHLVVGGALAIGGYVTVGTFLIFSTYLLGLTETTRMMSNMLVSMQMAWSSLIRICDVLALPAHQDPPRPVAVPDGPLGVRLEGVEFGEVLHGVDVEVAAGQTLVMVGPAGSGKTMLTGLLGGFYAPSAGRIMLTSPQGDVDISQVGVDDLRAAVGIVFDEPFLFSRSIRDNIALGMPGLPFEKVQQAARLACADEFIQQLPQGYDTVAGERGLSLSGGQRQRIALARALASGRRVLVLDDATSAIDAVTESAIIHALQELKGSLTLVLIAHRPSTLQLADRVALLSGGRIEAVGSLEEVTASNAQFRELMLEQGQTGAQVSDEQLWPGPDVLPFEGDETQQVLKDPLSQEKSLTNTTPELLERMRGLPAAVEQPGLDADELIESENPISLGTLFRRVRWLVVAGIASLVVSVACDLALPSLARWALDAGVSHQNYGVLAAAAGVGVVIVALNWVAIRVNILWTARAGERLLYGLRLRAFAHMHRLGMDYFESTRSGRLLTLLTTDIDSMSQFLRFGLTEAIVATTTLVGIIVMLVVTSPVLAATALAVTPVMVVATVVFRKVSSKYYSLSRSQISTVNAQFYELMNGLRTSQLHTNCAADAREFAQDSEKYRHLRMCGQTAVSIYFPGMNMLSGLAEAAVVGVGAHLAAQGSVSVGVLVAFVMYVNLLFDPIQQLSQIFDQYQQAQVGLTRLRDLVATPSSLTPAPADPVGGTGVALDDVRFAYSEVEVLHGVDLQIAPGRTVAVVGATGSGKSTIIKLLARFYDPTSGAVRVDGDNIRSMPVQKWQTQIGLVPQEAYLFAGTIASNIAYGRPQATRAEVIAAVRRIGAQQALAAIPGGLLASVERLSSGQRQLVALARAELVNPRLMLLDEATSTLDPATERAVVESSAKVMESRTSVIVAHRLATAQMADGVVVMDKGRIVEQGSHADLVSRPGGVYARLWQHSGQAQKEA